MDEIEPARKCFGSKVVGAVAEHTELDNFTDEPDYAQVMVLNKVDAHEIKMFEEMTQSRLVHIMPKDGRFRLEFEYLAEPKAVPGGGGAMGIRELRRGAKKTFSNYAGFWAIKDKKHCDFVLCVREYAFADEVEKFQSATNLRLHSYGHGEKFGYLYFVK